MKKFVLLGMLIFLLTGCSAEININLDKELLKQEINISLDNEELTKITTFDTIENKLLTTEFSSEVLQYYHFKGETSKENYKVATFTLEKNLSDYNIDYMLNRCYDNYQLTHQDDKFILSTSSVFRCYDEYNFDGDIILNITTTYKVLSNNADNSLGNTYTWKITKDNYQNEPISMELDLKNKSIYSDNTIVIIILCVIIGISLIVIITIYGKNAKNNEI